MRILRRQGIRPVTLLPGDVAKITLTERDESGRVLREDVVSAPVEGPLVADELVVFELEGGDHPDYSGGLGGFAAKRS